MRKKIANIITGSRILCSVCMLFCPVSSTYFYTMYLFCGFTDMVDGTIARKTKSVSEFGTKLDTVADIVFAAVCFVKILPLMQFPAWLWIWIIAITAIKIGNMVLELATVSASNEVYLTRKGNQASKHGMEAHVKT